MIVAMGVEEGEEVTLGEETETGAVVEVDMVAAETIEEAVAEGMTVEVEDMVAEDMVAVEMTEVVVVEVASVVGETTEGVVEYSEVAAEIETAAVMVVAETTEVAVEASVEGTEAVEDLGEVEATEEVGEVDLVVGASEGMVVVVVGTKRFRQRTRSSCRSKYGIDMVIQSYIVLFLKYVSVLSYID